MEWFSYLIAKFNMISYEHFAIVWFCLLVLMLSVIMAFNFSKGINGAKISPKKKAVQFLKLLNKHIPVHGDGSHYPRNKEYFRTPGIHIARIN